MVEPITPKPEDVAAMRATMNPKRRVSTRLGILHNGNVPIEIASLDPNVANAEMQAQKKEGKAHTTSTAKSSNAQKLPEQPTDPKQAS